MSERHDYLYGGYQYTIIPPNERVAVCAVCGEREGSPQHAPDPIGVLRAENEELKRWKAEAMTVLGEWEKVWEAAGKPGRLGSSKAVGVQNELARHQARYDDLETLYHNALQESQARGAEIAELKQWVSDACELLHELRAYFHSDFRKDETDALLRRAENP